MKKIFYGLLILGIFLSFTGCYSAPEEDFREVPVTNNPHVIPSHGSGFPMMGGG